MIFLKKILEVLAITSSGVNRENTNISWITTTTMNSGGICDL